MYFSNPNQPIRLRAKTHFPNDQLVFADIPLVVISLSHFVNTIHFHIYLTTENAHQYEVQDQCITLLN